MAHEAGDLNDIRAILGNDVAIKAYREGTRPFPDGTIIARLAWSYDASEENNSVFGRPQSFVAGPPRTGCSSWSRTQANTRQRAAGVRTLDDGKPADAAVLNTCFPCHQAINARDLVFTQYAP